ncbi:hypothetical protein GQ53DRAFT_801899 [Thozetella sp. PMI_491]|nr:hypothetical protein GQ53DRAFT_801899 [Thozetella sp. PMI_491]
MRFSQSLSSALLLFAAGAAHAASSWGFDDGSISVGKGASPLKYEPVRDSSRFTSKAGLSAPVTFGTSDSIKISLTAKDNGKAKRPHQVFLLLKEETTGLEAPFPLATKENGKAVVSISAKDIPAQLLLAQQPLKASVVIASFGAAKGIVAPAFDLEFKADPNAALPSYEAPLRYGKQPEIHHIFRADPKNPPKVISLFFALAVLATVPALFAGWLFLGANANHLTKAIGAAPLSHAAFFGSIVGMEFVFFLYYTTWNLFQTLPVILAVGAVTLVSGTKALGEVQSRRLAGER